MTSTGAGDGRPAVGVVGDAALEAAVEAAGAEPVRGDAAGVADADAAFVVAGGEPALLELVRAGFEGPALAVDAGAGLPSVPRDRVRAAVEAVLAGDAREAPRPLLSVTVDGEPAARVLLDAMLITAEPARIAEYSVRAGGREVGRFRADGVVVATPAGSHGYARAAGGPRVADAGAAVVVPVAPFRIDPDRWVLDAAGLQLRVERDVPVALVADDREHGAIPAGAPVGLARDGALVLYAIDGVWKNSNGTPTQ